MGEKKNQKLAGKHQALYRKYRLHSLDEAVGQEHITKTLANALKQGKISHAYLFTGPRGTGKTSIARILAHEINELPYKDDAPHLDIIEIDAASNRRIDDVRDLRDKVHIAPISAKYKVYIIDEVHMLTSESFNALLKTLEEPPEHVIFILATTEVHKLPATIISRTQRHTFRLVSEEKVAQHLAHIAKLEEITINDEALQLLARHGGGSFRDSISLLDQLSARGEFIDASLVELLLGLAPKELLERLLNAALKGETGAVLTSLESLLENGLTPNAVALQLVELIREKIREEHTNAGLARVMAELLDVQGSQYPHLKLETILLNIAAPQITPAALSTSPPAAPRAESSEKNAPSPPKKEKPQSSEPSPKTPAEPPAKQELAKPTLQAKSTLEEIEPHWPAILEATKKKNNPLYTVLRLATPEIEQGELVLIFSFPFHRKKIEEVKHKTAISEIVASVTGAAVSIRTLVDKTRAKPAATLSTPADPAHASLISNVQDIMGGGEVVNV